MVSERNRWDELAAAFAVLGRLHRGAPDETALAGLRPLFREWPLLDTDEARGGVERMRRSAESGESAEAIRRDHGRLYGVSAAAAVAPYESVHRGVDGIVFDEQTHAVRAAYRSAGLSAPDLNREPDDHIGLEFDFMAQLFLAAIDADRDGAGDPYDMLASARAFLDDHLLMWAPPMLGDVVVAATTHFMAGVAMLSRGAVQSAAATLS